MTLDVYAALFEDDLDAVAAQMDGASRADADQVRTDAVVVDLSVRRSGTKPQVTAVGPVGIEPTTRGLKVRCSAS